MDIFDLAVKATNNIFGEEYDTGNFRTRIIDLMGYEFYYKNWYWRHDDGYPSSDELEKLKAYAGPHGKTLYKIKQIKESANEKC